MTELRCIVLSMASLLNGELQSTCRQWYLVTLVRHLERVWPSPATLQQGRTSFMVSTLLTPKARMLLLEYVLQNQSLKWLRIFPNPTKNFSRSARFLKNTSVTYKTLNSLSKRANFGCYRHVTVSVQVLPLSILH